LEKILIESSEQCGRGDIPLYHEPLELREALRLFADTTVIVFDVGGKKANTLLPVSEKCTLFIGPEGGWGPIDKKLFADTLCEYASLGSAILRAETAAIVATSLATCTA
jgi:16S rRNA (uracil1498-N3)-methyltransferase